MYRLTCAVLLAAIGLTMLDYSCSATASPPTPERSTGFSLAQTPPEPAADTASQKTEEVKKIPLESVFSTDMQPGLKLVERGRHSVEKLHECASRIGASNVFLAQCDDVQTAVDVTSYVFGGGQSADKPVTARLRSDSAQYWLVAYLGVSGSGGAWRIKSAEVSQSSVRLAYTPVGSRVNDVHPYFFWVPLGKLEPRAYTIELFDTKQEQVVLSRRVIVPMK